MIKVVPYEMIKNTPKPRKEKLCAHEEGQS
jgi:hypothetical protein